VSDDRNLVRRRWDAEYARGRYSGEPPVQMISRIIDLAQRRGLNEGLYIGCGNGRNYIPLREAGLKLVGIDISTQAIEQLRRLQPTIRADSLLQGTVHDLPADMSFPLVVGIQVFQHGTAATAAEHIAAAAARVRPGGLFAIRVNAVGTYVYPAHRVVEQHDGGFTVEYLTGPKHGLNVHFFSGPELRGLLTSLGFWEADAMRLVTHQRIPPEPGHWCQWEGIWEYRAAPRR
jgi:SAM-dependent methyltransferase